MSFTSTRLAKDALLQASFEINWDTLSTRSTCLRATRTTAPQMVAENVHGPHSHRDFLLGSASGEVAHWLRTQLAFIERAF